MNFKGSFTAIVAAALVFLIASIGFTYYSSGVSQKALLEQQDSLELRQHWSNLRYLLDKAAAEALYDADTSANCLIDGTEDYGKKVNDYFVEVLDESKNVFSCEIPDLTSLTAFDNVEFSFTLKCSKTNSLSYSAVVKLQKDLSGTAPNCIVTDVQGNFQEIPSA